MARLAQLLASHGRILVLDAASTRVQAGLLGADRPALWHTADDEAGKAVFTGTAALLQQAGLAPGDLDAFAYCEGPGSLLGIRTVAMALRTWLALKPRPVYAYQSLAVAARAEWTHRPRRLTVIADARRETWHAQTVADDGTLTPLRRQPATGLPDGELLTPENFRAWSPVPRSAGTCAYSLATVLPLVAEDDLFTAMPAPDTFQHDAPDYKKWSARPHSAETAALRP